MTEVSGHWVGLEVVLGRVVGGLALDAAKEAADLALGEALVAVRRRLDPPLPEGDEVSRPPRPPRPPYSTFVPHPLDSLVLPLLPPMGITRM